MYHIIHVCIYITYIVLYIYVYITCMYILHEVFPRQVKLDVKPPPVIDEAAVTRMLTLLHPKLHKLLKLKEVIQTPMARGRSTQSSR